MADEETLKVYDARVADYAAMTKRSKIDPDLLRFMAHLPKNAFVLDLGCGPGAASAVMREYGFKPDPVDGSPQMVRLANEVHQVEARQAMFDDISGEAIYDGVWANFSLLHAKRSEMPVHLAALRKALKPGGLLHIGMKTGEGEERDHIGRFYTYYTHDELNGFLEATGFTPVDFSVGEDMGLSGVVAPYVTILARC